MGHHASRLSSPALDRSRLSQAENAYRKLKDAIVRGEMAAGMQAMEPELALRFGMSRTPVREALVRLEQEGFVELTPRRGMRVAPLSPRDIREITEVLACLEVEAAERLASRRCTPAELAAFEETIAAMDAALQAQDPEGWNAADYRFHTMLIESCGNRHLIETAKQYLERAHRFRALTSVHRAPPVYSNANHAAVVEAIRCGDPRTAAEIHRAHKRRWMRELDEILVRMQSATGTDDRRS